MFGTVVLAAAAWLQAEAQPPQELPSLPDHRTQFLIDPVQSLIASEWLCGKDGKPSRVKFAVTDVGGEIRNQTFKSELTELVVEGGQAKPQAREQIRIALAELTTVPTLRGKCLGKSPALLLSGFVRDGSNYRERRFEIEL